MKKVKKWFKNNNWKPHKFQLQTWDALRSGYSGLLNAPTGSGKTYAVLAPFMESSREAKKSSKGIQVIWICPIRALTQEIAISATRMAEDLNLDWDIAIRNGDTSQKERKRIQDQLPQMLITTPESLHLMLSHKNAERYFKHLQGIVVDEWHELLGSKRGVMQELANTVVLSMSPLVRIWGISATVGNLEEAMNTLLSPLPATSKKILIKSKISKKIIVKPILPDEVNELPWSGHLGINLAQSLTSIIDKSKSSLIFTNTRNQAELWYRHLLEVNPDWAGKMALHHGSMDKETRNWVEMALHKGQLKLVVCTSSLDLGVDFRPVETIIQVGGPKGVSRFVQRAGRSGHQPGATSTIYFLPTHSLELIESLALKKAIEEGFTEQRKPLERCFDVLVQFMVTRAVSDGFKSEELFQNISKTNAFKDISMDEWNWCLRFIQFGGDSLKAYDDFKRVELIDGKYRVVSRGMAMRHRLNIGVIVNDSMMQVKYASGRRVGAIEEWFISKLNIGDHFWFNGRNLKVKNIRDMEVVVKPSKSKEGKVPSWMGGRLPLSSGLSFYLRNVLCNFSHSEFEHHPEYKTLKQVLDLQQEISHLPRQKELLIEQMESKEGFHIFVYPFEGRFVHEAIASLLAYRISLLQPLSLSMAYNDYGFELISDTPIPIEDALEQNFFTTEYLYDDLLKSINASEMGARRFRDIAAISGLIFQGFPGKMKKTRHLQASSKLFYEVFEDMEPENLLLKQSLDEVLNLSLEYDRLYETLDRLNDYYFILKPIVKPSPFSFPIMVDRLRERLSSESLEHRIEKMQRNTFRS